MASGILQLPCLGRSFHIGMLYNCHQEKLIPGKNLWENTVIQSREQVSSDYEIITQDSLESTFNSLCLNDSLKLSYLAGMIEVSGSAEYLTDRVSSKEQARVTLKYSTTTHIEEVNAEELSSIQNPSASIEGDAITHVVTGILYGSDAFFVFDRTISPTENACDISGSLEALIRCIPKLESYKVSDEESQKLNCMFYGDLPLLSNPTSYKDIAKVYAELPTLLEGKNVPKVAFLHPLYGGNIICAPICSTLTAKVEEVIEWLHDAEIQCKDLKNNEHCLKFADFNNQLSSFLTLLNRFKAKSVRKISELIPKIRESVSKEAELDDEISSIHQSPFNSKEIGIYIKHKAKELKLLCQYMTNLCKYPSIHFISSEILFEITTDFKYDYVICFALNVTAKETDYLQKLKQHMSMTTNSALDCQIEWFEDQQCLKDLRHKSKQFLDFFKSNKLQEKLPFVVMDKNEEIESITRPAILVYSNGEPNYFEPPGRPGTPKVEHVSDDSIDLYWSPPEEGVASILSYNVQYCTTVQRKHNVHDWKITSTLATKAKIQIKGLTQDTEYIFSVEAVSPPGISIKSEEFKARTSPEFLARPADDLIKISNLIKDGSPMIYQLPLKPISKDPQNQLYKMEVGSCDVSTRKPERVLMMIGATGAGKSTLINALANYVLGIRWEDTFRFKVIAGEGSVSQTHSQTKYITAYTFHQTTMPYSLTIVDTPGFGDTMGIENDKKIARQIKHFFSNEHFKGVDYLHGIGFVTQASLPRLTPTQRYIFDAVLSIFGKDIVDNIFLMTTFADADAPPILEAVKVAKIPYKHSFKFNNSAIFARNDASEQFNHMFWEMGIHSLSNFFKHFSVSSPQSLKLTKEVLTERERLEALIPGLETQVKVGLSRLDQQHEAEINANKDFAYTIKVNKHRKIPLRGVYTTNCLKCSFTCHNNCSYSNDSDKKMCCAMTNGYCTACPQKCHWQSHSNTPHYFEYYDEYEDRTYDDLKKRYETAKSSKNKTRSMIVANEQILMQLQAEVYSLLDEVRFSVHRLDEIALRPNPLSDIEYIDLLIESEKREHKHGWKERIRQYEQIRKEAQVLKKIPKVSTKEKSKSWWKIWE